MASGQSFYILETLHAALAEGAFVKLLTSGRIVHCHSRTHSGRFPCFQEIEYYFVGWLEAIPIYLDQRIRRDAADCVAQGQIP